MHQGIIIATTIQAKAFGSSNKVPLGTAEYS